MMTEIKGYTPGPADWTYLPDSNIVVTATLWHDADGRYTDLRYPRIIAELPDDWDQTSHGHLIAAAPDMLASVKWLVDFVEAVNEDRVTQNQRDIYASMMDFANATIAKAEGVAA